MFYHCVPEAVLFRSRGVWLVSIPFGVVLLYLLGILVRGRYGIAVSVHNVSGESLRDVSLELEPHGDGYQLGALSNEGHARAFIQPRTESHIVLQYADGTGPHVETIVGYVESGYCGKAEVNILPQHKFTSRENIDPVFCKKSWLDFM